MKSRLTETASEEPQTEVDRDSKDCQGNRKERRRRKKWRDGRRRKENTAHAWNGEPLPVVWYLRMSTPSPACILQTGEREWTSKGEDWKKSAQRTGQVPSTTVSLS